VVKVKVKTAGSRTVNRTIQLVDSTAGTGADQSNLDSVDIPNDALLMGIDFCGKPEATADADEWLWEVSTSPSMQKDSSGARGILMTAGCKYELATNGASQLAVNKTISFPDGLLLNDGIKVYFHQYATNTKGSHKRVILFLAEQD